MDALCHGKSGVIFCQPRHTDAGPAGKAAGVGDFHMGNNSSRGNLKGNRKVLLHSACDWAAAGNKETRPPAKRQCHCQNSLSPLLV